jgi:protease-4
VGKLAEKKPVVSSLGDTGASGGYYVAMAANEIIAEPTTLTGAIGVVMAGLKFDAFLEQLGVSFDAVERGRHAGIYDPVRARTEEERALLRRQIELLYTDFVRKAAKNRGLSEEVLDRVAQGRVWTGSHAKEHALVDQLGGLDVALARVRELSGLDPEAGRVVQYSVSPVAARFLRPSPLERARGAQFLCPVQVRLD